MLPKSSSGRWLAGTTAAVVLIAVISVALALGGGSTTVKLDEGSPEAAVQQYMLAIEDGDVDGAYVLVHPDAKEACSLDEFRQQLPSIQGRTRDVRVRLSSVNEITDGVAVTVEITQFSEPDLFELDFVFRDGAYVATFTVRDLDGEWRVASAPWPYQSCAFARRVPTPLPTHTPEPTATGEQA